MLVMTCVLPMPYKIECSRKCWCIIYTTRNNNLKGFRLFIAVILYFFSGIFYNKVLLFCYIKSHVGK